MTARANSNRMAAPTSVIIDCFVCIRFISTSLLQACLFVSVQPCRSELFFLLRSELHLPIGRAVGTECSGSVDLFFEWIFAPVRILFSGECVWNDAR